MNLPAIDTTSARLPATYEGARVALAECQRVDECKDWADKAQALASYARQADDDTLQKLAIRIQARAIRRAGELLGEFDGRGRPPENGDGTDPILPPSQRQAGRSAGMSERQVKTAVRVANVPEPDFEDAVESDEPPTVTKLAVMGTTPRPGFAKATHLLGAVRRFAEFCDENEPTEVATGVMPSETDPLRRQVAMIDSWLDQFVAHLEA